MAEPPYGIIGSLLKNGEVVPFLGAGASLSGRLANTVWNRAPGSFLPNGRELAHWLADSAGFPSLEPGDRDDLAKVASWYVDAGDRPALLSHLRQVFDHSFQAGAVHSFLASLQVPLLIVTTNYDDLIERAFQDAGKSYHLVVHPTDRNDLASSVLWWKPNEYQPIDYPSNRLPLSLTDTTIIYKMHGSVDRQATRGTVDRQSTLWDSFVITEEDYVEFLARMGGQRAIPARFMLHFRRSRFLFLGYGLRDWNLRVLLKSLKALHSQAGSDAARRNTEDNLRSWAIQYGPSELEETLWDARKVKIYDMQIDIFIAKLREWMTRSEDATP